MKVNLYLVKFQSEYWDLPPFVWETEGVFLTKSQAVAFARAWYKEYKELYPDDFSYGFTIKIEKQVETPEGIRFVQVLKSTNGETYKR